jgi:hypothetical protein
LRKFVDSPYFNTDQKLSTLLAQLLDAPTLMDDREGLHALVLPDQAYDYHRISNLLSNLTRLVRQFLAQEQLRTAPFPLELAGLQATREQGLDAVFAAEHRTLQRRYHVGPDSLPDEWQYYQQFLLAEEYDSWLLGRGERRYDPSLPAKIEALEKSYALSMLKRICQWVNRQQILPQEAHAPAMTRFLSQLDSFGAAFGPQEPLFDLYRQILLTLQQPDEEAHYQHLKAGLRQHGPLLPTDERQTIYQYARNYCIRRSNQGQGYFLRELFELYQEMLREGLLFYEGQISHGDVKNLVSLGLRLAEYDWTEQFLADVGARISVEHRQNALVYNQAHLHYARGEYGLALKLLAHVEFEDVYYHLGARTLLLKMYYEQGDWLPLVDLMRAFEQWLRRNRELPSAQRTGHLHLIRLLRRLLSIRENSPQRAILLETIRQTQPLSQASWLIARCGGADR